MNFRFILQIRQAADANSRLVMSMEITAAAHPQVMIQRHLPIMQSFSFAVLAAVNLQTVNTAVQ